MTGRSAWSQEALHIHSKQRRALLTEGLDTRDGFVPSNCARTSFRGIMKGDSAERAFCVKSTLRALDHPSFALYISDEARF